MTDKEYQQTLLKVIAMMERMVDMQDRLVRQVEVVTEQVAELQSRLDAHEQQPPRPSRPLN